MVGVSDMPALAPLYVSSATVSPSLVWIASRGRPQPVQVTFSTPGFSFGTN